MPTAVVEVEFENLPSELTGLEGYDRAFLLIRFQSVPCGQAIVPVAGGKVANVPDALFLYGDSAFWESWLARFLNLPEQKKSANQLSSATVAICTRNRAADLKQCLVAVTRLPDDGQEILVIDNAPSDDSTKQVVEQFSRVRYVRTNQKGLDAARNCALREARNEIVAFVDDDATPDPNWLRAIVSAFDHPLVYCVTGLTLPQELETEAQEQFQHSGGHSRGFKRMLLDGMRDDPLFGWRAGAGVNMALRKSVLQHVGPFDEALDMGTPVEGGGDSDILYRILAAGYRIVYEPKALSWHSHRKSWKALRRQVYGYEMSGFALWMRCLFGQCELEVPGKMWNWLKGISSSMVRSLFSSSRRHDLDLTIARFLGASLGPWMYLYSRSLIRKGLE